MSTMVMRTPPQRGILKPEWPGSAQPGPGVWDSHPLRAGDWNLASREQGLKWPQTSAGVRVCAGDAKGHRAGKEGPGWAGARTAGSSGCSPAACTVTDFCVT